MESEVDCRQYKTTCMNTKPERLEDIVNDFLRLPDLQLDNSIDTHYNATSPPRSIAPQDACSSEVDQSLSGIARADANEEGWAMFASPPRSSEGGWLALYMPECQ